MATRRSTSTTATFRDRAFCAALTGLIVRHDGKRVRPVALARLAWEQADAAIETKRSKSR